MPYDVEYENECREAKERNVTEPNATALKLCNYSIRVPHLCALPWCKACPHKKKQ